MVKPWFGYQPLHECLSDTSRSYPNEAASHWTFWTSFCNCICTFFSRSQSRLQMSHHNTSYLPNLSFFFLAIRSRPGIRMSFDGSQTLLLAPHRDHIYIVVYSQVLAQGHLSLLLKVSRVHHVFRLVPSPKVHRPMKSPCHFFGDGANLHFVQ